MASDVGGETLRLLNEYANLKRLIDTHKRQNPSVPYSESMRRPSRLSHISSTQYLHPGGNFTVKNQQCNKPSFYRLNRNTSATTKNVGSVPAYAVVAQHNLVSNESKPSVAVHKIPKNVESKDNHTQSELPLPCKNLPSVVSKVHSSRFKLRKIGQNLSTKVDVVQSDVTVSLQCCESSWKKVNKSLEHKTLALKTCEIKKIESSKKPPQPIKTAPHVAEVYGSQFKFQKNDCSNSLTFSVPKTHCSAKSGEKPCKPSLERMIDLKPSKLQPLSQKSLLKCENTSSHLVSPVKRTASLNSGEYVSQFKLQKTSRSSVVSSRTTSSPVVKTPRKVQSKYKLVRQEKNCIRQTPAGVKKRVTVKQYSPASKYSWASKKLVPSRASFQGGCTLQTATTINKPSTSNASGTLRPFKSKYALSKCGSLRTSPRLVRHVNKYSVIYSSQKSRDKTTPSTGKFKTECRPFKTMQRCASKKLVEDVTKGKSMLRNLSKGKSELVVISGIVYKSSKTKLSRTGNMKPFQDTVTRSTAIKKSSNVGMKKQRIVTVRGIKFVMDLNRKVLKRLPVLESKHTTTAKPTSNVASKASRNLTRINIAGETYIQTRPGVLLRSSISQLRTVANLVLNRSILRSKVAKHKSQQFCMFYNKFGKCNNKEKGICRYIHDPDKIAICKRYLRGECKVQNCPFAHEICRSKMPVCTFFLHGRCNNDSCNYRHVNVNPNADVCVDFVKGYCPLGDECKKWHVTSCPQFDQFGNCDRGEKCPLNHKRKRPNKPSASVTEISTVVTNSSTNKRPLEIEGLEEHLTKRLPSFISILNDSLTSEEQETQNAGVSNPLQIKPDFLKHQ